MRLWLQLSFDSYSSIEKMTCRAEAVTMRGRLSQEAHTGHGLPPESQNKLQSGHFPKQQRNSNLVPIARRSTRGSCRVLTPSARKHVSGKGLALLRMASQRN